MADDGFAAFMSFVGDGSAADSDQPAAAAESTAPVEPEQQGNGNAKPNEDEYFYEEEQEREAMMRTYHHPMKQWFRQNPSLAVRCMRACTSAVSLLSVLTTLLAITYVCMLIVDKVWSVPALLARSQDVGAVSRGAEGVHPRHGQREEPCEQREHRVGGGSASASNSRSDGWVHCGRRAEPCKAPSEEPMGRRSGPSCR